jgi:hypothetical protein
MASQRAAAGGGREVAINPGYYSFGYQMGAQGQGAQWFGPGQPMAPQAPEEVKGRAFDFPSNVNLLTTQRPSSPITYETLRAFADSYDLLRLIIETRKDQMERLRWVIQLKDPKDKLTSQKRNRIKDLTKFFMKPDGEHHWNQWLRMCLEDVFVVDALTLHRRKTRGGQLVALDQIDGATMRRVLDDWGRTPEDPLDTAYQQILKGMPAVNYTKDEIIFRPRNVRVHKIYGYSPVEQIMMTINIGLRRQIFQLNFFTEGNMPSALIGVPEQWTPDQIRTFQEWFDGILSGNLGERRKARFVPSAVGKTYIPTQETQLFGDAEDWLARVCCFAFSINPQPFIKMMNRATSEVASQSAAAEGLEPLKNFVKGIVDDVLAEDFDAEDMELVWRGDDELDPVKRQNITESDVKAGLLTVNEGRVANGRDPYDDPQFDQPMFMTSNGLAPLILTPDAQGGPKVDENGDPVAQPGPGPDNLPEDQGDKGELAQKIAAFIEAGDEEGLANYLRKIEEEQRS